jgi:methylated-DNA-[protein]-cysteine S-methyltransferase
MRGVVTDLGTRLTPTGQRPLSIFCDTLDTPLGDLTLEASERGLSSIRFPNRPKSIVGRLTSNNVIKLAKQELTAYFASQLKEFSVPLDWHGTAFQESVWRALTAIPYGETVSYADIARAIGRPQSVRPTGGAVGRNPLPIIVPCHRVIGSDHTLTGFTGGLNIKVALLELEGRLVK